MTIGIFNSGNFTQDIVKKDFASMITRLMPNGNAPLFGLTGMLSSETALQIEHGFFTKTMVFPAFTLTASIDASQTTLTVASTANLLPGQLHRFQETGEVVIINSVLSPTEVVVTRGIGSTPTAVNIATENPRAYQVGNAYEEASLRPNALAMDPVRITNLTQIFRNTWAISGTAEATEVIAGDTPVAENRQDCAAFHAADIEKAILFGTKSQGYRNGMPFRTMDGLINIVSNPAYYPPSYNGVPNVYTASSTTNYSQLEAMLDPVFDQATDPKVANERIMFVGGHARLVLNNIGRLNGTYMMVDGQTSWGLQFSTFKTARGTFRLIEHPLFNSNPDWRSLAVVVDFSTFNLAYLRGRKTQNKEFNVNGAPVDNGIDAMGGTLTTECTCVVKNPPANAVIWGLTQAAQG